VPEVYMAAAAAEVKRLERMQKNITSSAVADRLKFERRK